MYNEDTNADMIYIAVVIAFIWIYVTIHVRSCFLSSCSMLNVVFSFPITLVLYRLIFRIDQFSALHILALFIVIGVAADDVFVFTDAWHAAGRIKQFKGDKER